MNDAVISIEPEDLELSPFNQRGGLGKAHQLFGEQLPNLHTIKCQQKCQQTTLVESKMELKYVGRS